MPCDELLRDPVAWLPLPIFGPIGRIQKSLRPAECPALALHEYVRLVRVAGLVHFIKYARKLGPDLHFRRGDLGVEAALLAAR